MKWGKAPMGDYSDSDSDSENGESESDEAENGSEIEKCQSVKVDDIEVEL